MRPPCTSVVGPMLAVALAGCSPPITPGKPAPPGPAVERPQPCEVYAADLEELAAQLAQWTTTSGAPGSALAIVVGDCLFTRAFGDGVDVHSRFQLASMTKTLTALTIVSLEEDGLLDRADPVADYVLTSSTASLDQLLAHRAGFPTYLSSSSLDLVTYLHESRDDPMWAAPDEVFLYSNPGFALAGLAAQNATGVPFEELVAERVFARAGMGDARMGSTLTDDDVADHFVTGASGDRLAPQLVLPRDSYLASTYYGPMGGAWASADDLARFMKALIDGDVIVSRASFAEMSDSRGPAYGAAVGYGQGVFSVFDGTVFHAGSVAGFLSEFDVHVEKRVGVAVLAACDWDFPYQPIEGALAKWVGSVAEPPEDEVAPTLAEIAGTYVDNAGELGTVVVVVDGAVPEATFTDLAFTSMLYEYAPGSFSFVYEPWGVEIDASFQRGDAGLYLVTLAGVAKHE